MPRAFDHHQLRVRHEFVHQLVSGGRAEPVLAPAQRQRRAIEAAQRRGLVGPVAQGAGLADEGVRTERERHVHAEIENAAPVGAVGEVVRLHLLAHDRLEPPGADRLHLRFSARPDLGSLGERVGVHQREARHPAGRLAQHLHRDDPAHGEAAKGESLRSGIENPPGEIPHGVRFVDRHDARGDGQGLDHRREQPGVAHHARQQDQRLAHPARAAPSASAASLA